MAINWRQRAAAEARAAGIPVSLFLRQIAAESGFDPTARSGAGAQGIAQIMPFHDVRPDLPGMQHSGQNPAWDLHWAAQEDARNLKKYGNPQDMLSIYNSGRPWSQGQRIGETRSYVSKILSGTKGSLTGFDHSQGSPSKLGQVTDPSQLRKLGAAYFLQRSHDIASGQEHGGGLLGLAMARQQLMALGASVSGSQPLSGGSLSAGGSNSPGGLNPDFQAKLSALIKASGGRLTIKSGYRSVAEQTSLWNAALKKYGSAAAARKWVAPPGHSNHNKGIAADLGGDLAWAHANAGRFGLHFPMSWEAWHIEPIGSR